VEKELINFKNSNRRTYVTLTFATSSFVRAQNDYNELTEFSAKCEDPYLRFQSEKKSCKNTGTYFASVGYLRSLFIPTHTQVLKTTRN